ncbi:hypothetical protein NHX12_005936 [Muraenolepis orangiensis]|uniref:Kinesin motor domain-containing protein n=1 Tax=Muraenolepis orangiensis TaxID=630683 RepID=A0A9Q0DSI5_9TELE|nr:hypothetical protein NHX12_005936 [Muraenolepis orangiensis]
MAASSITIQDPRNAQIRRSFCFDYAYWSHSGFARDCSGLFVPEEAGGRYVDQASVFQDLGEGILHNALQTGSGKSYSMVGYGPNKGLVPTLCDRLFQAIKGNQDSRQCQVVDLLSRASRALGGLRVREEQQRGFYVEGLRTVPCDSAQQVEQLMEQGTRTRTTAATHMNANSSRSHMLIILQLKQVRRRPSQHLQFHTPTAHGRLQQLGEIRHSIFSKESITKHSNINMVDLAGSERQRTSGSEADRLKEGTAINLSLTTLGNVISALADVAVGKKVVHIPYRVSVLTKLLQSALGGNSRTVMIATLSPADICYEESLSTLRYAERAKRIQNRAVVNESPTERLVKELKMENARLQHRLSRLGQDGRRADEETKEIRQLLTHNELQIRAIQTLWEQHLQEDRLVLGSNSTYLFIGYPSERGSDDWTRYDYDYFHSELAAAEGINLGPTPAGSGQTDPSLLAVFYDYMKLMPMVAEANQISQELNKGVVFKLEIKNLALSDSKGHDLEKEIVVRVTSLESKQVWVWSKVKFVNRKFLMEETYQQHQGGEGLSMAGVPRDKDPFWDPIEPLLLGSTHLWLQSLAFRIPLEEQLELVLEQCCGLRWIKGCRNRGVQIGFRLFECSQPLYTPAVWHNVNPVLDHRFHFACLHGSQRLLDYLQTSALVLELWGLQEGCTDLTSSMEGVKMTSEGIFILDQSDTATACVCVCVFVQEESDQLGLRLFVDEQSRLLRDFSEQLEQCVSALKQDVAAIVRRKRERSGVWA